MSCELSLVISWHGQRRRHIESSSFIFVSRGYPSDRVENTAPLFNIKAFALQYPIFTESLLTNGWCVIARFAALAQQLYMPYYAVSICYGKTLQLTSFVPTALDTTI
jgi:cellulose synthase/poly-beta-1,6-N-acetylglucosamine synthase-like glycosyltransferase